MQLSMFYCNSLPSSLHYDYKEHGGIFPIRFCLCPIPHKFMCVETDQVKFKFWHKNGKFLCAQCTFVPHKNCSCTLQILMLALPLGEELLSWNRKPKYLLMSVSNSKRKAYRGIGQVYSIFLFVSNSIGGFKLNQN